MPRLSCSDVEIPTMFAAWVLVSVLGSYAVVTYLSLDLVAYVFGFFVQYTLFVILIEVFDKYATLEFDSAYVASLASVILLLASAIIPSSKSFTAGFTVAFASITAFVLTPNLVWHICGEAKERK